MVDRQYLGPVEQRQNTTKLLIHTFHQRIVMSAASVKADGRIVKVPLVGRLGSPVGELLNSFRTVSQVGIYL